MASGGAGTIAVTDSSFLPSSQPSSGSWISHCISTALAMASAGGSAPPVVQTAKTDWPGPPRAKRRKLLACFAWNDAKPCVATPCRFAHVCSRCGGEHKKGLCTQAQEASYATSGEGQRHA